MGGIVRTTAAMYAILSISIFCYFLSCGGETKVIQFMDPGSKYEWDDGLVVVSFVIRNPPRSKDKLINLAFKHSQTLVQNDTMRKYTHYSLRYYKESWSTRVDYIEERESYRFYYDYLDHRRKDLLIDITTNIKDNTQEIMLYNYSKRYQPNEDRERRIYIRTVGNKKVVDYVLSNPPKNEDGLLNLVSEHFQSFIPNDTIERYVYYIYKYLDEYNFFPSFYLEGSGSGNLLITVNIEPKLDKRDVTYIKRDIIETRGLLERGKKSSRETVFETSDTLPAAYETFTDNRDGMAYKTVVIGGKRWMAENLNYKTPDSSWCYDNADSNCVKYGRLYVWNTAMKACPAGWHLPSRNEWVDLMNAVGSVSTPDNEGTIDWYGAGKLLKAKSGWNKNGDGNDVYGFAALPTGYRDISNDHDNFDAVGNHGYWWTNTEYSEYACFQYTFCYYDYVDEDIYKKSYGFFVRCVVDTP